MKDTPLRTKSKAALCSLLKQMEKTVYNQRDAMRFYFDATNEDCDDYFLSYRHIKNDRQIGIIQGIRLMQEFFAYFPFCLNKGEIPTRSDFFERRKQFIEELEELLSD
jgi:hypothetical protein